MYIKVEIGNRTYNCLLDSGAQLSILPAHIVPNCNLSPSNVRLKTANNIVIPILGQIDIDLEINSLKLRKNFLVTEHIAEVMLGYDFPREHEVTWNFADSTITLHGQTIPTCNQHETWYRKLVLTHDVKIPSRSEMNASAADVSLSVENFDEKWTPAHIAEMTENDDELKPIIDLLQTHDQQPGREDVLALDDSLNGIGLSGRGLF